MNKLEVLKQYRQYVLYNKSNHNWQEANKCHCGMLLNSVNLSTENIYITWEFVIDNDIKEIDKKPSLYRDIFYMYSLNTCDTTKLPFTKVLNTLLSYGFTLQELISLEHLADTRFKPNTEFKYTSVDSLLQYLTNWINYEEQLVQVTTKTTVPVTVPGL